MSFSEIGCAHLRYHKWATERIFSECIDLNAEQLTKDLKVSFGSIYGTLSHLFQADSVWLRRLESKPTGLRSEYAVPGCMFELRDAWLQVQEKLILFAEDLSEDEWESERSYTSFAGIAYQTPIWQMVLHLVNHGSHHRGQVTGMLRQLDRKPADLDLIVFYRAQREKEHALLQKDGR